MLCNLVKGYLRYPKGHRDEAVSLREEIFELRESSSVEKKKRDIKD